MRSVFKIVGEWHDLHEENPMPADVGVPQSSRLERFAFLAFASQVCARWLPGVTDMSPGRHTSGTTWRLLLTLFTLGPLYADDASATSVPYEPGVVTTSQLPPPEPYTPTLADPVTEPWRWTRFPELAGTGVECVSQTSDGDMWFGVDHGVMRYDGLEWTRYGASDGIYGNKVRVLHPGDDGTLYAGTALGISRLDGDRWQRLFPPTGDVQWNINDLELVDTTLWAATSLGLVRLPRDGKPVLYTSSSPDSAFNRLIPYVATQVLPEAAHPPTRWHFRAADGLGLLLADSRFDGGDLPAYVVEVAPDGPARRAGIRVGDRVVQGATGLGTGVGESFQVVRHGTADTLTISLEPAQIDDPPALFAVSDVMVTDEGVWAGVGLGGVLFFDPKEPPDGDSTARFVDVAGAAPLLARTPDGAIWVPTAQSETPLYRITGDDVTALAAADMNWSWTIYASALTARNGELWLGLHHGTLRVLRDGAWSDYHALPTAYARVTSLHEATDGAMWLVVRGNEAWRLDRSARYATYEHASYEGSHGENALLHMLETAGGDTTGYLLRPTDSAWTRQAHPSVALTEVSGTEVTSGGQLWIGGTVDGVAATLTIDASTLTLTTHPGFSHRVSGIRAFAADIWVGADPNTGAHGRPGGALRFDGTQWHHIHGPGAPVSPYGFAQRSDGDIITTGDAVRVYDGDSWSLLEGPVELQTPFTQTTIVDRSGALWISSRAYGLFRLRDGEWTRFTPQNGLPGQQVTLRLGPNGQAWCESILQDRLFYRFDGERWVPALPANMSDVTGNWRWGGVDEDGSLWLNRFDGDDYAATRITFDDQPPETAITLAAEEISQPGNAVVSWSGADRWRDTPPEELRYAWRLDGGDWSSYATETNHVFLELSDGDHRLEVRARDRDFNVDPTPAFTDFTVVPPVWKQAWFLSLIGGLLIAIAVQTTRVLRRERRLSSQNRQLTLERAAESVRAEAMDMRSADDIRRVVGVVRRELIGLGFDERRPTIINYPDPDDGDRLLTYFAIPNPRRFGMSWTSPDLWELDEQSVAALFTYNTGARVRDAITQGRIERLDQPGTAASVADLMQNLYGVDPTYMEHVDIGSRLTNVPFDQGQLCLRGDDYLTEDEIDVLRALCDALSLGFTRYEDFRQLEQASTNKSQFLRRMSHDLRSPMNAIIGYTRVVLRRARAVLDERQVRNLENIETSSTNLLSLINDILDLSRIEAGHVDINVQPVNVAQLASECADALESIVQQGVVLRRDLNDVGSIHSDLDRLRQVIMNLLGNATKFTDSGSITVSLKRDDDAVELSVVDTGIGIPAEDLPHIFDEFRQVERQGGEGAEGTGLGLAIAKKTVNLLGGEITATSQVGVGTTFAVRLPT
jgi:signal transduction histidine kinase/ligand-binding sensor domain-containing protein